MSDSQGILLEGDVYFDRLDDNGARTGLVGPLNTLQLAIETPTEAVTRTSKKKGSYGAALDEVIIAQPSQITMQFDDQPAELLAMALLGELEVLNQGSGDITAQDFTLPANQRWLELGKTNLATAGISVTDSANADAPLVLGTDVEISYSLGLIRALKGGAVESGGAIKVTAQYNAVSGSRIKGAIKPQVKAVLLLDGRNLATGAPVKLRVPMFVGAPSEAVDLMAAEFVSTTLVGKALLQTGESAPFYLDKEDLQ